MNGDFLLIVEQVSRHVISSDPRDFSDDSSLPYGFFDEGFIRHKNIVKKT